jgi:hypothetical protein
MSSIDSEVERLRLRLAALEQQKRNEDALAAEKRAFPMKTLEAILDEKRKKIEFNRIRTGKFYYDSMRIDQEKLSYLEPIFNMLKNIQERLEVLENK